MNTIHTVLTTLLAASLTLGSPGGDQGLPGVDPIIHEQGLIGLVDDPQVTIDDFVAAFNAGHPDTPMSVADAIESRRLYLFELDLSQIPPEQIDAVIAGIDQEWELNLPPQARWIEFNYFGGAPEGKSGSTWVTGIADADLFGSQYSMDLLNVPQAHGLTGGAGTVVAVLDTGIDPTHPALEGLVLPGGFNFIDDSTDTLDGGDGIDNDGDQAIDEMAGHGTFVSGLIALTAPQTRLLPVVVLNDDGVTDLWPMVEGMFYAIDSCVDVINMSLTTTYRSEAVEEAIVEARSKGISIVSAAGNFNREEPRENPGMQSGCIGVAATDHVDVKAPFSNFNDKVNLSAPGASAKPGGEYDVSAAIIGPIPGGDYAVWEGTSFSTAFVSGAVALLWSQRLDWPRSEGSLATIEGIVFATAEDIDAENPAYVDLLGAGRLDIGAAAAVGPAAPALGDVTLDGVVDVLDLVEVILGWGPCQDCPCPSDVDRDGTVGVEDVVAVILNWG